ncbi:MAG: gliding motility protein GldC [Sphingobacteriales bacterium]|jgi:gliding motility-associated protein GldC|nr:gliding motility protein GldC [Sphingobacteriales bacterium]MBP9141319.1 gliding motility protein GldC [Chitinophagales bacterium]MDA0197810.1 gliding motility protein GldC [Bacteroidota bacterium]MBK7528597.1 gliding motility protein GldC [Sphingobacteriales bacterium]MBK8679441.1 gliding motility protein GldC [Sphingobacteriales bacterium]
MPAVTEKDQNNGVAITNQIIINVGLNSQKLPVQIKWQADGHPIPGEKDAKAMLMALWDEQQKTSLRIDLWTKEMQVREMQHFIFQTVYTMADTLQKATNDPETAAEMREFANNMAKKWDLFVKRT